MNGSAISLDLAVEALKDFFVQTIVAKNKIDQVIQLVSENYNISPEDLKSKKKTNNIAIPRQIAMYICRIYLEENLTKIEDQLQAARRIYNMDVTIFNTSIQTFPCNIIASLFRFREEKLFNLDPSAKENVKIDI